jgi:hypothetical protein
MLRLADLGAYWRNTRKMPTLLRMFCQGCMVVSPLMLLLIMLPIGNWNVDGQELTYRQFWTSAYPPIFISGLLLMTIGAWGAAARNSNSRWAVVLATLVPFLCALLLPSSSQYEWFDVVGATLMSLVMYLLLFHLPAVVKYYERDDECGGSA